MVRIKICGITNFEDASAACSFGADAIGFVFARSPRQINSEAAKSIIDRLPPYITTVGVFVNEDKGRVNKIAKDCNLTCLQFHGGEKPEYCGEFTDRYKVIKAVRMRDKKSLTALKKYDVDAFLLDSFVKGRRGGTGVKFDWKLAVEAKRCGKPVILAGGISIENLNEAIRRVAPYAIDVSTAVERSPGKKNHTLMKRLIENVRSIN